MSFPLILLMLWEDFIIRNTLCLECALLAIKHIAKVYTLEYQCYQYKDQTNYIHENAIIIKRQTCYKDLSLIFLYIVHIV